MTKPHGKANEAISIAKLAQQSPLARRSVTVVNRAVRKKLKRFVNLLNGSLPHLNIRVFDKVEPTVKSLVTECYQKDEQHGTPYPGGARTLRDAFIVLLLELGYVDRKKKNVVITSPTQTTKSAIQQVLLLLMPWLEYVLNGQKTPVVPVWVIPNFERHGQTMLAEIRQRAGLFSFLTASLRGGPELSFVDYYRNILGVNPGELDRFVVRSHRNAADTLSKIRTEVMGDLSRFNLFVVVDEAHYGSSAKGIYPATLNTLREMNKNHSVVFVSATPTEFYDPTIYGKIHHIPGWVDDGYVYFYMGAKKHPDGRCTDKHGRTIYRLMPGAKIVPLTLHELNKYCRKFYGLGSKDSLELEDFRSYQVEEGHFPELLSDTTFSGEHLNLLVRTLKEILKSERCVTIRVPPRPNYQSNEHACMNPAGDLYAALKKVLIPGQEIVLNLADAAVMKASEDKGTSIADIIDYTLGPNMEQKVIVILVDRCKMSHRFSSQIDVAIDLGRFYNLDESCMQGLAARLTGFKAKNGKCKTRLLLSTLYDTGRRSVGAYMAHLEIQRDGECVRGERNPSGRTERRMTDGSPENDNRGTVPLLKSDLRIPSGIFKDATACFQKFKVLEAHNETRNKKGIGQSLYINQVILKPAIRASLSKKLETPIAMAGKPIASTVRKPKLGSQPIIRLAAKGDSGMSWRHRGSFLGGHNPVAKCQQSGTGTTTGTWGFNDAKEYTIKGVKGSADYFYQIATATEKSKKSLQDVQKKIFGGRLSEQKIKEQPWFNWHKTEVDGLYPPRAHKGNNGLRGRKSHIVNVIGAPSQTSHVMAWVN